MANGKSRSILDKKVEIQEYGYSRYIFMDPKALSNLDPKLQETYARVMGTSTPPPSSPATQTPPASDGLSATIPSPQETSDVSSFNGPSTTPVTPTPLAENPFANPPMPTTTVSQTPEGLSATPNPIVSPFGAETGATAQPLTPPAAMAPQEVSSKLKIAYIVGGVLFFAVYAIFWIKIFNLPFIF